MRGFSATMPDRQVAALGNCLMHTCTNPADKVTLEQVAALRARRPANGGPPVLPL